MLINAAAMDCGCFCVHLYMHLCRLSEPIIVFKTVIYLLYLFNVQNRYFISVWFSCVHFIVLKGKLAVQQQCKRMTYRDNSYKDSK